MNLVVSTCGHELVGHYHPIIDKGRETQILCCACAYPGQTCPTEIKLSWQCPFEKIRDYPDCWEDCPDTEECKQPSTQGVKVPQASTSVVIFPNSEGGMGLHPGEQNEIDTRKLIEDTHRNFLQIGKLLRESRENAYWSTAGKWESFSDYIESLGISKSAGYQMIIVYEFQLSEKLTEAEILEIGIAKMGLLTSADKCGKMTDEVIELAKVAPVRDLKEHLGHKVLINDPNHSIICPRCNWAIEGAKWVRLTTT